MFQQPSEPINSSEEGDSAENYGLVHEMIRSRAEVDVSLALIGEKSAKIAKIYWPGIWACPSSHIFTLENLLMVRKSAWLVILGLMTTACLEEPDCYQLNNEVIGIAFKKLEDSSADTVSFTLLTAEPPLIFPDTTVSRLFLRLNYFRDETTFIFAQETSTDTLQLAYLSQAQFVSEDCGEKFVVSELRVGYHSFDSVRLVFDTPTQNGSVVNLEIFQ